ncbi:protein-disulfide reductase DsbD [Paraferrimonas sp. SM1919]|uniref:protein-disulfide reductase DsbD n=1 Tax=Paraferrimonas sp. SM1919 TaxID=2662263 RepID=UPI0013D41994|nr:protein-disulfide reductase DsbD [Paraferrimonas sp. SM1919]
MKRLVIALVALIGLINPVTADSLFDSKKFNLFGNQAELLPVDRAFVFDSIQLGNQVLVRFEIQEGYYLYRDKLEFKGVNAELGKIDLPAGESHFDEFFGEQAVFYKGVEFSIDLANVNDQGQVEITFMGCAEGRLCYPPTKVVAQVTTNELTYSTQELADKQTVSRVAGTQVTTATSSSLADLLLSESTVWVLAIFFALGLGLAFTPCVFPMYPILASIIGGQGGKLSIKKGLLLSFTYVQGMAITYSLLGLVVASAGLQYQAALQHPVLLISLALLFVVLSLSMFGVYELTLPAKWQQKIDGISQNQKGGKFTGVFLMGVLSGLIASPCTTAPLSGALLYVAQTGDMLLGFFALYLLSLGMGVPLLLFGASGGKLLPRAGAWMDIVKGSFGLLLLAVAILFIERMYVGIWTDVLWALLGIGAIAFWYHHNKNTQASWHKSTREVLLFTLVVIGALAINNKYFATSSQQVVAHSQFIQVKSLADVKAQLAKVQNSGKVVMLDFYADWCVACKDFEHQTFNAPEVQARFDNMLLLQADVTANDETDIELLEHFNILGLPSIIFFDEQGNYLQQQTVTGFMNANDFGAHLDNL